MSIKTKIAAGALAALTFTTAVVASSGEAQARPRWGWIGAGFAAGALIGAAAVSSSYAGPAYVVGPGYRSCRYVERFDSWGNLRVIKVCDVVPY